MGWAFYLLTAFSLLTAANAGCSFTFKNWCYKAVTTKLKQGDAENWCKKWSPGAHLAWIKSRQEAEAVKKGLQQISGINYWYIGLEEHIEYYSYSWTSGAKVSFLDFAPNEPTHKSEMCITMVKSMGYNYKWADVTCSRREAFVCKGGCKDCPPGYGYPFHGSSYHFVRTPQLDWFTAARECAEHRATLVSIESAAEQQHIENAIATTPGLSKPASSYSHWGYWTSGNDIACEGHYKWAGTGKPFGYKNWNPSDPNNHAGKEHCVSTVMGYGWKWADDKCKHQISYICEYKPCK